MTSTLRRIQRGMEKLREQIGSARNYGEWIARIASVLKAKVVFKDEDGYEWKRSSGESIHSTNNEVERAWKACRNQAGLADTDSSEVPGPLGSAEPVRP